MPSDKMQLLAGFIGEWECQETYHAGGWTPQDVHSTSAHDSMKWGANGNAITASYSSESSFGHYEASDIIIWSETDQAYLLFFADSFAPGYYQLQKGWIEGNQVIFEHETQNNNVPGKLRRTYTLGEGTQELAVIFTAQDGSVTKLATITKKKVG